MGAEVVPHRDLVDIWDHTRAVKSTVPAPNMEVHAVSQCHTRPVVLADELNKGNTEKLREVDMGYV